MPQQNKKWTDMNQYEKVEYLWDLKDIWELKLREVANLERVWEDTIYLFGIIPIGKKVRREVWRPRKEKRPKK